MSAQDDWYQPENEMQQPDTHVSPSGRYTLTVRYYSTGPHSWCVTQGVVTKNDPDPDGSHAVVATLSRGYSSFLYAWLEDHPQTGNDYLIGSEDYHGGVTVANLTYRTKNNYTDENDRWCLATPTLSPNQCRLAVIGCYWASGYDVRVYDVSRPDALPYPILYDSFADHGLTADPEVASWDDDTHLRVGYYVIANGDFVLKAGATEDEDDCYEMDEVVLEIGAEVTHDNA